MTTGALREGTGRKGAKGRVGSRQKEDGDGEGEYVRG